MTSEPKGLDNRSRDKNGEIRHKREDTHVGTLRKTDPNFAAGVRADAHLGTILQRAGQPTLSQYRKNVGGKKKT
jgi:hypothetical protein